MTLLFQDVSKLLSSDRSYLYVFGGSFDPPHIGHQSLILKVLSFLKKTDQLLIIPSYHPPQKKKSKVTDYIHRFRLCQMVFSNIDERIIVDGCEEYLMIPSYTEQTLRFLKSYYRDYEIILCIGTDQYNQLEKWRDSEVIMEYAQVLVYPRQSNRENDLKTKILLKYPQRFYFIEAPLIDFSSSQVRSQQTYQKWFNWLPIQAKNYIQENKIDFQNHLC